MRVDVRVFRRYRKHPFFSEHESRTSGPCQTYRSVPVFVVDEQRLDAIVALESDELIGQHCREPLLLFTDRRRVLAVSPEGYDYARYVCAMDQDTVNLILTRV